MIRKRDDGRWEGRIVVGHKENGEPIFRYVLAKTQKELLAKLHRDMDLYQDAQLTEDSCMTLPTLPPTSMTAMWMPIPTAGRLNVAGWL